MLIYAASLDPQIPPFANPADRLLITENAKQEYEALIMKRFLSAIALVSLTVAPTIVSATPHCRPCPYSCMDLGMGNKDCSFVSESRGICCLDLTKKALEVAMAQENVASQPGANRPLQVQGSCPPGFRPSEQKCSPEERRRGCKDMRMPNGMGCVRR
jgi:hypothetical protein